MRRRRLVLRFTFCLFRSNVGIRKPQRGIYGDERACVVGGPRQGFPGPCSLLPGFLSSRGPPLSLVFRTEDVQRSQSIEAIGFPLLRVAHALDEWLVLKKCVAFIHVVFLVPD